MKKILSLNLEPFAYASAFFLFFQLMFFNKGISFRDEGFLLYNSMLMEGGRIPYKDFFLTTTPGSFYIQAFLMKIFGDHLFIDRILYILCVLFLLFLVSRILKFRLILNSLILCTLGFIFVAPGGFAFYNTEGLVLIILIFIFLKKGLERKNKLLIFTVGFLLTLIFFIKQSYGAWMSLCVLISIIILIDKKNLFTFVKSYFLGIFSGSMLILLYLLLSNSLNDFIYYVFTFSSSVKSHRLPFLVKSVSLGALFYLFIKFKDSLPIVKKFKISYLVFFIYGLIISAGFINNNSSLTIYYFAIIILPLVFIVNREIEKNEENSGIILMSLFLLFLFMASASSGKDYLTLIIISPFLLIFTYMSLFYLQKEIRMSKLKILILATVVSLSLVFSIQKDLILGPRKIFGVYELSSASHATQNQKLGFIKTSVVQKREVEDAGRILADNDVKSLICFPYCPMLNYLTGIKNPLFYSFFYPETFRSRDQIRAINELKNYDISNNLAIMIQKKGEIEPEANFENKRLATLRNFILSNSLLVAETKNFGYYIYGK